MLVSLRRGMAIVLMSIHVLDRCCSTAGEDCILIDGCELPYSLTSPVSVRMQCCGCTCQPLQLAAAYQRRACSCGCLGCDETHTRPSHTCWPAYMQHHVAPSSLCCTSLQQPILILLASFIVVSHAMFWWQLPSMPLHAAPAPRWQAATGSSMLQAVAARLSWLQAPGFGAFSDVAVLQALACVAWCHGVGTAGSMHVCCRWPRRVSRRGKAAAMWREQVLRAGSNVQCQRHQGRCVAGMLVCAAWPSLVTGPPHLNPSACSYC
jgi:hypothetical protein